MTRKLSAIEIAEGAMLADIAAMLQLAALYLPVVNVLARFLIPIVFAVLVLRRRLYVGALSLCVAAFVAVLLAGLSAAIPLALSCGAGLFLGYAMKRRVPHVSLLLLGATGGTLVVGALVVLFALLAGLSAATMARQMERSYELGMALAGQLADWIGAAIWWRQTAVPLLEPLARAALIYWWALAIVVLWLSLCPVVTMVYFTTNIAVRALGYDVRPFPGPRAERLILRFGRGMLGLVRWLRLRRKAA